MQAKDKRHHIVHQFHTVSNISVPFSCVHFDTSLSLCCRYHLIQTYLTSSVYLAISWLALFLPPKCIAERLAIAMTILLTLTSMFSSERRSFFLLSFPLHFISPQVCTTRVICNLPRHLDGFLHPLRLYRTGKYCLSSSFTSLRLSSAPFSS